MAKISVYRLKMLSYILEKGIRIRGKLWKKAERRPKNNTNKLKC